MCSVETTLRDIFKDWPPPSLVDPVRYDGSIPVDYFEFKQAVTLKFAEFEAQCDELGFSAECEAFEEYFRSAVVGDTKFVQKENDRCSGFRSIRVNAVYKHILSLGDGVGVSSDIHSDEADDDFDLFAGPKTKPVTTSTDQPEEVTNTKAKPLHYNIVEGDVASVVAKISTRLLKHTFLGWRSRALPEFIVDTDSHSETVPVSRPESTETPPALVSPSNQVSVSDSSFVSSTGGGSTQQSGYPSTPGASYWGKHGYWVEAGWFQDSDNHWYRDCNVSLHQGAFWCGRYRIAKPFTEYQLPTQPEPVHNPPATVLLGHEDEEYAEFLRWKRLKAGHGGPADSGVDSGERSQTTANGGSSGLGTEQSTPGFVRPEGLSMHHPGFGINLSADVMGSLKGFKKSETENFAAVLARQLNGTKDGAPNEAVFECPSSISDLNSESKLTVAALRDFSSSTVSIGKAASGRQLYAALVEASSPLVNDNLRDLGIRAPFNMRRALCLSSGFLGGLEESDCIAAVSEWPWFDEEDWAGFRVETASKVPGKATSCVTPEAWISGVHNMASAVSAVYGTVYKDRIIKLGEDLLSLHRRSSTKHPLVWIRGVFEKLLHVFVKETRARLDNTIQFMGLEGSRSSISMVDLRYVAKMPAADGRPVFSLPFEIWNLSDDKGFFATRIIKELERKVERAMMQHVHGVPSDTFGGAGKGRVGNPRDESNGKGGGGKGGKPGEPGPKHGTQISVPMPPEWRAYLKKNPLKDANNQRICFNAVSHAGCSKGDNCPFSHRLSGLGDLKAWYEGISPPAKIELLRRGGARFSAKETQATAKVAADGMKKWDPAVGSLSSVAEPVPFISDIARLQHSEVPLEAEIKAIAEVRAAGAVEAADVVSGKIDVLQTGGCGHIGKSDEVRRFCGKALDNPYCQIVSWATELADDGISESGVPTDFWDTVTAKGILQTRLMNGADEVTQEFPGLEGADFQCDCCWIKCCKADFDDHTCEPQRATLVQEFKNSCQEDLSSLVAEVKEYWAVVSGANHSSRRVGADAAAVVEPANPKLFDNFVVSLDNIRIFGCELGDNVTVPGIPEVHESHRCYFLAIAGSILGEEAAPGEASRLGGELLLDFRQEALQAKHMIGDWSDRASLLETEALILEYIHDISTERHRIDYHCAAFFHLVRPNLRVIVIRLDEFGRWSVLEMPGASSTAPDADTAVILCKGGHASSLFKWSGLDSWLSSVAAAGRLQKMDRLGWANIVQLERIRPGAPVVAVKNLFKCDLDSCANKAGEKSKFRLFRGGSSRYGEVTVQLIRFSVLLDMWGDLCNQNEDGRMGRKPFRPDTFQEVKSWYDSNCDIDLPPGHDPVRLQLFGDKSVWEEFEILDGEVVVLADLMVKVSYSLDSDNPSSAVLAVLLRITDRLVDRLGHLQAEGVLGHHILAHLAASFRCAWVRKFGYHGDPDRFLELEEHLPQGLFRFVRTMFAKGFRTHVDEGWEPKVCNMSRTTLGHEEWMLSSVVKDIQAGRVFIYSVDKAHKYELRQWSVPMVFIPPKGLLAAPRLVHNQTEINEVDKVECRPPVVLPTAAHLATRVLACVLRRPGVRVLISTKDVSGAFRLLCQHPLDTGLMSTVWQSDQLPPWDLSDLATLQDTPEEFLLGLSCESLCHFVIIWTVSSFGYARSPGLYDSVSKTLDQIVKVTGSDSPERHGEEPFFADTYVDDGGVVEPCLADRPWVAGQAYVDGMRLVLGPKALNIPKDAICGQFQSKKIIWGFELDLVGAEHILWRIRSNSGFLGTGFVRIPRKHVEATLSLLQDPSLDVGSFRVRYKLNERITGILAYYSGLDKGLAGFLTATARMLGTEGEQLGWISPSGTVGMIRDAWSDYWCTIAILRELLGKALVDPDLLGVPIVSFLSLEHRIRLDMCCLEVTSDASPSGGGFVSWNQAWFAACPVDAVVQDWRDRLQIKDEEVIISVLELVVGLVGYIMVGSDAPFCSVLAGIDNRTAMFWIRNQKARHRLGAAILRVFFMRRKTLHFDVFPYFLASKSNEYSDGLSRLWTAKGADRKSELPQLTHFNDRSEEFAELLQNFFSKFSSWTETWSLDSAVEIPSAGLVRVVGSGLSSLSRAIVRAGFTVVSSDHAESVDVVLVSGQEVYVNIWADLQVIQLAWQEPKWDGVCLSYQSLGLPCVRSVWVSKQFAGVALPTRPLRKFLVPEVDVDPVLNLIPDQGVVSRSKKQHSEKPSDAMWFVGKVVWNGPPVVDLLYVGAKARLKSGAVVVIDSVSAEEGFSKDSAKPITSDMILSVEERRFPIVAGAGVLPDIPVRFDGFGSAPPFQAGWCLVETASSQIRELNEVELCRILDIDMDGGVRQFPRRLVDWFFASGPPGSSLQASDVAVKLEHLCMQEVDLLLDMEGMDKLPDSKIEVLRRSADSHGETRAEGVEPNPGWDREASERFELQFTQVRLAFPLELIVSREEAVLTVEAVHEKGVTFRYIADSCDIHPSTLARFRDTSCNVAASTVNLVIAWLNFRLRLGLPSEPPPEGADVDPVECGSDRIEGPLSEEERVMYADLLHLQGILPTAEETMFPEGRPSGRQNQFYEGISSSASSSTSSFFSCESNGPSDDSHWRVVRRSSASRGARNPYGNAQGCLWRLVFCGLVFQVSAVGQADMFDTSSTELRDWASEAALIATHSLAQSSLPVYKPWWRRWLWWNRARGTDWFLRAPWTHPDLRQQEEARLAQFVAYVYRWGAVGISAVNAALASIRYFHLMEGIPDPIESRPFLALVRRGISRLTVKGVKRAPITPDMLRGLVRWLRKQAATSTREDVKRESKMAICMVVLGFFFLLRKSELLGEDLYMKRGRGLRLQDVVILGSGADKRVSVTIRSSKTDQGGKGTVRVRSVSGDPDICPVRAAEDWLELNAGEDGERALHVDRQGKPITGNRLRKLLLRADWLHASETGGASKTSRIGTHSLRIGGATCMLAGGASILEVMREGRWQSVAWSEYIREALDTSCSVSGLMVRARVRLVEDVIEEANRKRSRAETSP